MDFIKKQTLLIERIERLTEPVRKQQRFVEDQLAPYIKAQQVAEKLLRPNLVAQRIAEEQTAFATRISNEYFKTLKKAGLEALALQVDLQKNALQDSEQALKKQKQLSERIKTALICLANYGWFLDLTFPFSSLWEIQEALESGEQDAVDRFMVEYYESKLDGIESSINELHPKRTKILWAAFKAHRRGEYSLSIPVLLAQTDGICKEVMDEHLFMKANKKPRTSAYVDTVAMDTLYAALLSPLACNLPISASNKDRNKNFNQLNRHTVLHGESLDYATQINACKSISLIHYVSSVLNWET